MHCVKQDFKYSLHGQIKLNNYIEIASCKAMLLSTLTLNQNDRYILIGLFFNAKFNSPKVGTAHSSPMNR